jgi:mannose-6-phosphate isomerase-like protein (cupin superfamily)
MPIYTRESLATDKLPWVEIDDFEFFHLGRQMAGNGHSVAATDDGHRPYWGYYQDRPLEAVRRIEPEFPKERIVVISGTVQVESEHGRFTLDKRDYYDVPASGATITNTGQSMAELAHVKGHWTRTIRSEICMFQPGNPCDYHYHDGDEYWVVFRGHFTLDYNGLKVPVGPGQLLAAGKGFEHGALEPEEVMSAIVLAMPVEDRVRDGHLNRANNGEPVPGREVPEAVWEGLRRQAAGETPVPQGV